MSIDLRSKFAGLALAVAAFGMASMPAVATPVFSVSIYYTRDGGTRTGGGTCTGSEGGFTGNSPQFEKVDCADLISSFSIATRANTGLVGISAAAVSHAADTVPVGAEGLAAYSDTVVFTSSDPTAHSVTTSMNVLVHGHTTGGQVGANATLNGQFVLGFDLLIQRAPFPSNCTSTLSTCDQIVDLSPDLTAIDGILVGVPVTVPLNTPVVFGFTLGVDEFVSNGGSATLNWSDTFGLPATGNVFNLPDGFTANSPTSFIVNNRFAPADDDGDTGDDGSVGVPEPSALGMFGFGALLIGGFATLRRRRSLDA